MLVHIGSRFCDGTAELLRVREKFQPGVTLKQVESLLLQESALRFLWCHFTDFTMSAVERIELQVCAKILKVYTFLKCVHGEKCLEMQEMSGRPVS